MVSLGSTKDHWKLKLRSLLFIRPGKVHIRTWGAMWGVRAGCRQRVAVESRVQVEYWGSRLRSDWSIQTQKSKSCGKLNRGSYLGHTGEGLRDGVGCLSKAIREFISGTYRQCDSVVPYVGHVPLGGASVSVKSLQATWPLRMHAEGGSNIRVLTQHLFESIDLTTFYEFSTYGVGKVGLLLFP